MLRRMLPPGILFALACVLHVVADEPAARLLPADRAIEDAIDHYVDAALRNEKVSAAPLIDD